MKRREFVKMVVALVPGLAAARALWVKRSFTHADWLRGAKFDFSAGSIPTIPGGLTLDKLKLARELLDAPTTQDNRYIYFDDGWRLWR